MSFFKEVRFSRVLAIAIFIVYLVLAQGANGQTKKEQIITLTDQLDSLQGLSKHHATQRDSVQRVLNEYRTQTAEANNKTDAEITQLKTQIADLKARVIYMETERKQLETERKQLEKKLEQMSAQLESNALPTVSIGTQVWMTNNLDVATFRNGDPIPQAKTNEEWVKAANNKQPAWCYYENDPANGAKYGKLYNWYAVIDSRGLAPIGYHISSDAEWTKLGDFLGSDAGKKMKSKNGWYADGNGTNTSGFSGFPSGYRDGNGAFIRVGYDGYWWSSTECNTNNAMAWDRYLSYPDGSLLRSLNLKHYGLPVRCLRD